MLAYLTHYGTHVDVNTALLGHVVQVLPGLALRVRQAPVSPESGVALVQIWNLSSAAEVVGEGVTFVAPEQVGPAVRLQAGDVLFASRGASQRAAVYRGQLREAVAGAQLTTLRPRDPGVVLPEYIALYLSHGPAQKYLAENRSGSYIPLITKAVLEKLPIVVPALHEQRQMVDIYQLVMRETALMERLRDRRLGWLKAFLHERTSGR
jgi:hypothetical protein